MENLFYYFLLLTSIRPKQRMMLSKMIVVLTDTYMYIYIHNCIFLINFSLIEPEPDQKDNIFEIQLTQQQHYFNLRNFPLM